MEKIKRRVICLVLARIFRDRFIAPGAPSYGVPDQCLSHWLDLKHNPDLVGPTVNLVLIWGAGTSKELSWLQEVSK